MRATTGLAFLGISLAGSNDDARPDAEIGAPGAAVRSFVIVAREDLEIARQVCGLLAKRP